jgi:muramoyltetrapeptide carboxypeptidase LdcA involved in peptidoglycan recycling
MIMALTIATSAFLLTTALFTSPTLFANAIMQYQNMVGGMGKPMANNGFLMNGMNNNNILKINGTINLKNNTNNISIGNATVPFLRAAQSTQGAIANGKIIGGNIGITQGYLTYNFVISNQQTIQFLL